MIKSNKSGRDLILFMINKYYVNHFPREDWRERFERGKKVKRAKDGLEQVEYDSDEELEEQRTRWA
jgi:hypothetical protein